MKEPFASTYLVFQLQEKHSENQLRRQRWLLDKKNVVVRISLKSVSSFPFHQNTNWGLFVEVNQVTLFHVSWNEGTVSVAVNNVVAKDPSCPSLLWLSNPQAYGKVTIGKNACKWIIYAQHFIQVKRNTKSK